MNPIEKSFEIENAENKEQITAQVTFELNQRLIDMGEISTLDKREIDVLKSIHDGLEITSSYDNLEEEIPEELLKEYVRVMFEVEQDKLVKNIGNVDKPEVAKPFLTRYEQAKVLGADVTVEETIAYVLELPEKINQ